MTDAPTTPSPERQPADAGAGRIFIDCEFDGHDGPLLSMALVCENGRSIHIRVDVEPMDLWVRQNVLPLMDRHDASESATVYHNHVGRVIRDFLGEVSAPVIVADSPVDIGRFCRAISTGDDGGWASADYPLMTFEVHNVDCYPTNLEGAVQHNAWWDAMALRHRLAAPAPQAQPDARAVEARRNISAALERDQWCAGTTIDHRDARTAIRALSAPAADDGWNFDPSVAPEGEQVILATEGGHVGEAIAPVQDDPDDGWFWAGAGFVHKSTPPIAWRPLPAPPVALHPAAPTDEVGKS